MNQGNDTVDVFVKLAPVIVHLFTVGIILFKVSETILAFVQQVGVAKALGNTLVLADVLTTVFLVLSSVFLSFYYYKNEVAD